MAEVSAVWVADLLVLIEVEWGLGVLENKNHPGQPIILGYLS